MFDKKANKYLEQKGLTFIELLVVVAVLLILTTISVIAFRSFHRESDLSNSTEKVINVLRLAQNKTLASEGSSQWGVYFDNAVFPHKYILFKGSNYASRDSSFDEAHSLPSFVEIYNIDFGGGNEVVFNRISGGVSQDGNMGLRLVSDISKTRTIYVDSFGQIGISVLPSPADGRITDSRHVHYNLSWSIQDATDLKFYFPATGQTETIDMAPYFDSLKTEFNWDNESSPFVIEGNNQVFKVHTHALDISSTLLCIHRDRNNNNNNQEIIIYIIDGGVEKEIAHYLADDSDTVEKGIYVNTIEIQ